MELLISRIKILFSIGLVIAGVMFLVLLMGGAFDPNSCVTHPEINGCVDFWQRLQSGFNSGN